MLRSLKYLGYTIACQEVPNEVSLIIDISGCPHQCGGCHSPQLWEYTGRFIKDDLDEILSKYEGMITCVCFMGGDQNMDELNNLLSDVRKHNLKTCIYSGSDDINQFTLPLFDYIKFGHFDINLGGLDKKTTNQKFYKVEPSKLTDMTYLFQQKKSLSN